MVMGAQVFNGFSRGWGIFEGKARHGGTDFIMSEVFAEVKSVASALRRRK